MIITLRKKQADLTLESYSIINSKHDLSVPFLIKLKRKKKKISWFFSYCRFTVSSVPSTILAFYGNGTPKFSKNNNSTVKNSFSIAWYWRNTAILGLSYWYIFWKLQNWFVDPFPKNLKTPRNGGNKLHTT